jgi:4-amino-4-deoxy-L-arabinose transferase-like glycosyltransferase
VSPWLAVASRNPRPLADRMMLFGLAFVVRLIVLVMARWMGRFFDTWEYEIVARNLLAGRGFVYPFMGIERQAYLEPLYPFFVAAMHAATGGSFLALAVAQCLLSSLLAVVVYELARLTFDRRTAIMAGLVVVIHPGLAANAVRFHVLTFDALGITTVALCALLWTRRPQPGRAALFGAVTGACVLTRPTILAFSGLFGVWLAWRRRVAPVHGLIALGIAVAIVAPWVVRNYLVLDAFVLTRSHVGFNFWLGNHPGATGGEGDPADPSGSRSLFDRAPAEFRELVLAQPDEIAQDRVFREAARRYVLDDSVGFVLRTATKLVYFWSFPPYAGKRYRSAEVVVYRAFYIALVVLALIGVGVVIRQRDGGQADGVRIVLLMLAVISLAQALFYVQGRHRLAVEPLLAVLSARGVSWLASRRPRPPR